MQRQDRSSEVRAEQAHLEDGQHHDFGQQERQAGDEHGFVDGPTHAQPGIASQQPAGQRAAAQHSCADAHEEQPLRVRPERADTEIEQTRREVLGDPVVDGLEEAISVQDEGREKQHEQRH